MANIPGLETWNLLLLVQTVHLWICTSTTLNTSPLCSNNTCSIWSGRCL